MSRCRNEAEPADVQRALRSHHKRLITAEYMESNLDLVTSNYKEFILELFDLTPRPTEKLLQKSAAMAYDHLTKGEADAWSRSIFSAIKHCRQKAKSMIGG